VLLFNCSYENLSGVLTFPTFKSQLLIHFTSFYFVEKDGDEEGTIAQ
jgi:hypothetical protein